MFCGEQDKHGEQEACKNKKNYLCIVFFLRTVQQHRSPDSHKRRLAEVLKLILVSGCNLNFL